jgi:hypothetical protein
MFILELAKNFRRNGDKLKTTCMIDTAVMLSRGGKGSLLTVDNRIIE